MNKTPQLLSSFEYYETLAKLNRYRKAHGEATTTFLVRGDVERAALIQEDEQ